MKHVLLTLSLLTVLAQPVIVSAQSDTTTYTYDVHGRLVEATDTDHQDMYYAFDKAHNLTFVGVNTPPPGANNHPTCSDFTVTVDSMTTSTHAFPIQFCSDPDGDPLTLTQVTQPGAATASIDTNNRIFIENIRTGYDFLTYTMSDGNGGVASAELFIAREGEGEF